MCMRWNAQQVFPDGVGDDRALPGMAGLLRTVRSPEFAGITFHEVEAKSALNRVPDTSMVPFRWTVNPYRGCSHACTYCLAGHTRVLLADGRTRPIAELRVGDVVIGTEPTPDGGRRFVRTSVLAHWSTVKPAHELTLADGTDIVASGEHRFLTTRGWRHLTGGWCGSGRRPRLRRGDTLLGPGRFRSPSPVSAAYREGYLHGLATAGGGQGPAAVRDGRIDRVFPIEQLELEPLARVHHFLATRRVGRSVAVGGASPVAIRPRNALAASTRGDADWCAGFLAGVVDVCGTGTGGEHRIVTGDGEVVAGVAAALDRLGFRFTVEPADLGARRVRVLGGTREWLRFLAVVDPSVARARDLSGAPVRGDGGLEVIRVRPLGVEMPMYDITTGTGDFVAEGVVSHNCFARNTHTYLDFDAGADFDRQIVVKVNVARVLERELRAPSWNREPVAMGTNTDPYQRAEGRYRLMPGVIRALARSGTPFSVLTKGTVLSRDLPLLRSVADDVPVGLGVSVALLDRSLQATLEPGAPTPAARLDLVRRIVDAGLPCGVMVAPVLPLLTDSTEALDELLERVAATGAVGATVLPLHLRRGTREWFFAWLARERPDLLTPYRRLYRRGAYVDPRYRKELAARVAPLLRRHGLARGAAQLRRPEGDRFAVAARGSAEAGSEQLSLL